MSEQPTLKEIEALYISQIEAEDRLAGQRMGWMLQFNGFLIASYGLAVRNSENTEVASDFLVAVPVVGLAVTFFGLLGVWAAQSAQNAKRKEWIEWTKRISGDAPEIYKSAPRFQSDIVRWHASAVSGYGLCVCMLAFWAWLLWT